MIRRSKIVFTILVILSVVTFVAVYASTRRQKRAAQGNAASEGSRGPKLFAEGVVNTTADAYGPAFTPDGKTIYFTKRADRRGSESIVFSRFMQGRWTEPQTAEFSGQFSDKEPFVSPDGKRLFFASKRPRAGEAKGSRKDFDLWMVERVSTGWSAPVNLGDEVNTPGYENYPAVSAKGTLYFGSVRDGGRGEGDLYRAVWKDGRYASVENLGAVINTPATEADPFVAPDESYIIFSSDRAGGYGEGDLYISFNEGGRWSAPRNLGATVNTKEYEYTPLVSPDGRYLFFSRGWGGIYQIEMSAVKLERRRSE